MEMGGVYPGFGHFVRIGVLGDRYPRGASGKQKARGVGNGFTGDEGRGCTDEEGEVVEPKFGEAENGSRVS